MESANPSSRWEQTEMPSSLLRNQLIHSFIHSSNCLTSRQPAPCPPICCSVCMSIRLRKPKARLCCRLLRFPAPSLISVHLEGMPPIWFGLWLPIYIRYGFGFMPLISETFGVPSGLLIMRFYFLAISGRA